MRTSTLDTRLWEVFQYGWHLGFTAFGGPPVHFKILYDKYVTKLGWVDEQMYQELFSVSQAISGPASTKMFYCLNLLHSGFLPAILGQLLWSLPGALGMYGLALGVSNIGQVLPRVVYALLSGLNAATVGIIALAAVQLAQKAITDDISRILVFLGAAAGLMYNALWYFPLLMFIAGCVSISHDSHLFHSHVRRLARLFRRLTSAGIQSVDETHRSGNPGTQDVTSGVPTISTITPMQEDREISDDNQEPRIVPSARIIKVSWQIGTTILILFASSFIAVMILRGVLRAPPILFSLFSNMFLAGTIIFGGGPVVIPLLREYVVSEGWVSPRDFLLGLAMIQSFPGPNFNFAVYLGGLTAAYGKSNAASGAILAYLGIFLPGLILCHGIMGVWSAIRGNRWVKSGLRGVNAAAVGLIYTAVYRLWQIGFIDEGFQTGKSLGDDPWYVVIGATSYVGGMWFRLHPPIAIVLGAVMGLVRYAVIIA
ncbi:chromate transporter-domain-containing protein [Bisporella sp. PMI_857]|nr:chromate transporter-domain-containing protein [Bisporella sp. PMI_857]